MRQLKMLRPSAPVVHHDLPAGMHYEFYKGTDAEIADWLTLNDGAILPDSDPHWFRDIIVNYPDLVPAEDLFFVVTEDGRRVATSASVTHANGAGYIHMVACAPEYRGRGIGRAMLSYSLEILERRGCPYSYLTTDDFRLAAIKTYLDAGFLPVLRPDPEADAKTRWEAVLRNLRYREVGYITEDA